MQTPLESIIRQATRKSNERLTILTTVTHEAYESNLALTGHEFYAIPGQHIKPWNNNFRQKPDNYHVLPSQHIPANITFDLVLSQHKFGSYQLLQPIAKRMGLSLVSLEHTLPMSTWDNQARTKLRSMTGDIDVFISDYSAKEWGWNNGEYTCILHGINPNVFKPAYIQNKTPHILSVVNDFIGRGRILGYSLWQQITKDLPTHIVGDSAGLSVPAKSTDELVWFYQNASVFLNTSLVSPIPSVVLEAMSCGIPVVTTDNCLLPEVVEDGVNGFITNDPKRMRYCCELLLSNPELSAKMGEAARKTILEKFSLSRFVDEWNSVFDKASNIVFKG